MEQVRNTSYKIVLNDKMIKESNNLVVYEIIFDLH